VSNKSCIFGLQDKCTTGFGADQDNHQQGFSSHNLSHATHHTQRCNNSMGTCDKICAHAKCCLLHIQNLQPSGPASSAPFPPKHISSGSSGNVTSNDDNFKALACHCGSLGATLMCNTVTLFLQTSVRTPHYLCERPWHELSSIAVCTCPDPPCGRLPTEPWSCTRLHRGAPSRCPSAAINIIKQSG
jgi:hypothetical protein